MSFFEVFGYSIGILIVFLIAIDVFKSASRKISKSETEYDRPAKVLLAIIIGSVGFGILFPIIVYQISSGDTVNAVVQYIGTIIGAVVSVSGAVLAVLYTFRNQQLTQKKEKRAYQKLKLKNISQKFQDYFMDNNFLGMQPKELLGDDLVYKYTDRFLEFYLDVCNELVEIDGELFEKFSEKFEDEFQVCKWVSRFKSIKSSKFNASILGQFSIFDDEIAKERLKSNQTNGEKPYEYQSYEVFLVLEGHLSDKIPSFRQELNFEIKNL